MLKKADIEAAIEAERSQAIHWMNGESAKLRQNRKTLRDYYDQKNFTKEKQGQSNYVTSDVADVVNMRTAMMVEIFTRNKHIASFDSTDPGYEEEAKEKTKYANWVFTKKHNCYKILHDLFFDGELQYMGIVKVYQDKRLRPVYAPYKGINELQLNELQQDENYRILEIRADEASGKFDVDGEFINSKGAQRIENIKPNEFIISQRARSMDRPPFCGTETPVTRSDLIEMGFDAKLVRSLPKDSIAPGDDNDSDFFFDNQQATQDPSLDIIILGEFYQWLDVNQDGIAEYWQFFYANGTLIEKNKVSDHPFAVYVPQPKPHQVVGTCSADQTADIQKGHSIAARHMFNNIYANNYARMIGNERVDVDDFLAAKSGGFVACEGIGPVQEALAPIPVTNQIGDILQTIEYIHVSREIRTGVRRQTAGLDPDVKSKTASEFKGLEGNSNIRINLSVKLAEESVIERIFELIIKNAMMNNDETIEFAFNKEYLSMNPSSWHYKATCKATASSSPGDRVELLGILGTIYQMQLGLIQNQLPLADYTGVYNTLDRYVTEAGLKDGSYFFRDPKVPESQLQAQLTILQQQNQQLQAQIKQEGIVLAVEEEKTKREIAKETLKQDSARADRVQENEHHVDEVMLELTRIEGAHDVDVPGSVIGEKNGTGSSKASSSDGKQSDGERSTTSDFGQDGGRSGGNNSGGRSQREGSTNSSSVSQGSKKDQDANSKNPKGRDE